MRLNYVRYGIDFWVDENEVAVLTIENPTALQNVVRDIWRQINGLEGGWIFSEDKRAVKITKECELITNPFAVDLNDKKILANLYKEMISVSEEELMQRMGDLRCSLINMMDSVCEKMPYPIIYNEDISYEAMFKAADVKLDSECEDGMQYLTDYICLKNKICGVNNFVLFNIRQFFSEEQMEYLYEKANYEKIRLIVIEGMRSLKIKYEKRWILDKDLCIIEI